MYLLHIIRFLHFNTRGLKGFIKLAFWLFLLFGLYNCSTNKAIRMREKSLNEWDSSEREKSKKSVHGGGNIPYGVADGTVEKGLSNLEAMAEELS
ncbi:hypothetical protein EW142_04210 [Flagellimonas allohymeniacidonis]|uniref:Uncharacterized protein n=2 Tax=Flagellimonas allohymeniacidonis TaxID=2517819 RepID=A0A4Q8QL76_9FLAO|nr:hypothetical protein EW142_04210 [Allomuricauda hymeniacidonis]